MKTSLFLSLTALRRRPRTTEWIPSDNVPWKLYQDNNEYLSQFYTFPLFLVWQSKRPGRKMPLHIGQWWYWNNGGVWCFKCRVVCGKFSAGRKIFCLCEQRRYLSSKIIVSPRLCSNDALIYPTLSVWILRLRSIVIPRISSCKFLILFPLTFSI